MDGTCCGLRPMYAAAGKVGLMDARIPEPAALDVMTSLGVPTLSQQLGPRASRHVPVDLSSIINPPGDQDGLGMAGTMWNPARTRDLPRNAQVRSSNLLLGSSSEANL